jgi:hypothetical protein
MSELDSTENLSNAQVPEAPTPPAAPPADSAPAPTEAPNGEAQANQKDDPPQGEEPEWFKQRIKQVTRQRRESERRADRLAAEIEALKRAPQAAQPKSTELRPENFPTYDSFIEAKIQAGVREASEVADSRRSQTEAQRAAATRIEAFMTKATEQAEAADIDLDAVMETLTTAPLLSQSVLDRLAESKQSARLAEFLAENPAELDRVSRLGPALAKKALDKVEAGLAAPPKPNATNAPPPPPKVGGRSVNQTDWRKTDSMDDYGANWQRDREARLKD